jgi:uncharacterized coiled-coil protein SlyX
MASCPEPLSALSARISKLEHQLCSPPLSVLTELKESIANHDRQLESLDYRISALERNLTCEIEAVQSSSRAPIPTATPLQSVSPTKSLNEVEFPFKDAKRLDGIISFLTRKHCGNVHDKGTVTIASKSVDDDPAYAARNVAALTSDSFFH